MIGKREFFFYTGLAAIGGVTAAWVGRNNIQQFAKEALVDNSDLYRQAALFKEYGFQLAYMPLRVDLQPFSNQGIVSENRYIEVKSYQDAADSLQTRKYLEVETTESYDYLTGLRFSTYRLRKEQVEDRFLLDLLGIDMPTPSGESMPDHALAMRVVFPSNIRAIIAPGVPIPKRSYRSPETSKYKDGDYKKLHLPRHLLSQIFISNGHEGYDTQIVPEAERMIIGGHDFKGRDFTKGNISRGTVYLWADGTNWGLAEWPSPILTEENSSSARLYFPLNPVDAAYQKRVFIPYDNSNFNHLYAQLIGYLNSKSYKTEYVPIGPTVVYRQDVESGEKDIIFIAPFIPLVAPYMMHNLLFNPIVGNNYDKTDPNNLIMAIGDGKYNTRSGFLPALLWQNGTDRRKAHDTYKEPSKEVTDFSSVNNSIAFYLGYE